MKEFVEFIIKQFVNNPEAVVITESMDGENHVYSVKVADEDMGVVIGREGKTINSIRNLAKAKAIKENIMIRIFLEESANRPAQATESVEETN
jgi:predicted RNA-binding protein YlqC (UPF0109 family)